MNGGLERRCKSLYQGSEPRVVCQVWSNFLWETGKRMCRGKWKSEILFKKTKSQAGYRILDSLGTPNSPDHHPNDRRQQSTRMLIFCPSTWPNIDSLTWCHCFHILPPSTYEQLIYNVLQFTYFRCGWSSTIIWIPFWIPIRNAAFRIRSELISPSFRGVPGRASGTFHCLTSILGPSLFGSWDDRSITAHFNIFSENSTSHLGSKNTFDILGPKPNG